MSPLILIPLCFVGAFILLYAIEPDYFRTFSSEPMALPVPAPPGYIKDDIYYDFQGDVVIDIALLNAIDDWYSKYSQHILPVVEVEYSSNKVKLLDLDRFWENEEDMNGTWDFRTMWS